MSNKVQPIIAIHFLALLNSDGLTKAGPGARKVKGDHFFVSQSKATK